jgi:hypothetical protein
MKQTIAPEMPHNFEEALERAKKIERNIKRIVFLKETALKLWKKDIRNLPAAWELAELDIYDIDLEKNLDIVHNEIINRIEKDTVTFQQLVDGWFALEGRQQ